ncbi:MAG: PHP domain-containing protein [Pseudonocardiales bacterium]
MRVDLHTHSTASDGTLTPAELMLAAEAVGLDVIALCDHDTTGGWDEAAAALPAGLSLVRGAELSCSYSGRACRGAGLDGAISMHLLAYLFDRAEPALADERSRVRQSRLARGRLIVERLRADGVEVSWDEVLSDAAGGTVGRPHVARALLRRGYVADLDAAFGPDWVGTHGRYWAGKEETDARAAVGLVRAAGGVTVLAHPAAGKRGRTLGDEAIADLAAAGLSGLEVEHVDHTEADRRHLAGLAADLGLVTTGSSDFHGTNKTTRLGAHLTDPDAYGTLVAPATGCAVVTG